MNTNYYYNDRVNKAYDFIIKEAEAGKTLNEEHLKAIQVVNWDLRMPSRNAITGERKTLFQQKVAKLAGGESKENFQGNVLDVAMAAFRMNQFSKEPRDIRDQPGSHVRMYEQVVPRLKPKEVGFFLDEYIRRVFEKEKKKDPDRKPYLILPSPFKEGTFNVILFMGKVLQVTQDPETKLIVYGGKGYETVDELVREINFYFTPADHLPDEDFNSFKSIYQLQ